MDNVQSQFDNVFGHGRGTSALAVGIKPVIPRLLVTYLNVLDHPQGRVKIELQIHSHQIVLTAKAKRELHEYHDRRLLLPYEGDELLKALTFPTAKNSTKEKMEFGKSELRMTRKRTADIGLVWFLETEQGNLKIYLTGDRLLQIREFLQNPVPGKVAVIKKLKSVGI